MSSVPLVAGALQGHVTSGFGVSRDSLLFQAVAVPIAVPGSAPSGALVATKVVDSLLARDVKAATSAEIVFFVRDAQGARIAATSFATPLGKHLAADVADQPRSHAVIGGTRYATQGAAVTTAGGEVVGGYVVMSAHDAASAELAQVRRALLLAALVGFGLSALAAFVAATRFARPVQALATLAERATRGRLRRRGADVPAPRRTAPTSSARSTSPCTTLAAELRDRERLASTVGAAAASLARAEAAVAAAPSVAVHRLGVVGGRVGERAGASRHDDVAAHRRTSCAPGDVVADRYRIEAVLGVGRARGDVSRARPRRRRHRRAQAHASRARRRRSRSAGRRASRRAERGAAARPPQRRPRVRRRRRGRRSLRDDGVRRRPVARRAAARHRPARRTTSC